MSGDQDRVSQDVELEKNRARYGLLAVVISNLAIATVAMFGVWQLDGDTSVIIGVLTAAFTAVSSMTTAYLGIKAVSNTAKSIASSAAAAAAAPTPAAPATPTTATTDTTDTTATTPVTPATATTAASPAPADTAAPPAQRGQ
ncbi:hypothetical protein [Streptomyces humi]|uniref:hypothetical protein n=1 Tax=Streptomyces humi TaxID=1428620 RepID=UPI001F0A20AE|nr:hypothetical protein [Streptomyces humi]